jgi:hypothetical protein
VSRIIGWTGADASCAMTIGADTVQAMIAAASIEFFIEIFPY